MTMRAAPLLLLLVAAVTSAGCKRAATPAAQQPPLPPLPELRLSPMIGALKATAASAIVPVEANVQQQLREFADIALRPGDHEPRIATRAERALLEHEHALLVLEPGLADPDPAIRARAAFLCGRTGAAIAVFPLLLRFKYEMNPTAVVWIADALAHVGNFTGLPWIDGAMTVEATQNEAGQRAIEICRLHGHALPDEPTWADLQQAMRDLHQGFLRTGTVPRPPAPPDEKLVAARIAAHLVATEGFQLRPVDEARYVLTRLGKLAVPHLAAPLHAEEPYLRTMVLQVIAGIGPAALPLADAIVPLLGDPLTASYALRALGEIGATTAADHVLARLSVVDTELRAAAANAAGVMRLEAARPRLEALLADPNEPADVRVQAAFALCRLGAHPAARSFLDERQQKGDYHTPTLALLLERLQPGG